MKKFLIMTQSYYENNGGYVVLHKLCDQINRLGREAYLIPYVDNFEFGRRNFVKPFLRFGKETLRRILTFKINPEFKTPILKSKATIENNNDWIVIYPEVVFGNPLLAKNIVRWFLHHPGYHTNTIYYGKNELYFRYHSGIQSFESPYSRLSKSELRVVHYPLDLYNESGLSNNRIGTAYCVRKGFGKPIVHNLSNSILIDGKSHKEISEIFKRVKQFISYDVYTAYSSLAVLCGCESVVIPDEGVSEQEWMPNILERHGLAYGFENLEKSKSTRKYLIERIQREQCKNLDNVSNFICESDEYFEHLHVNQSTVNKA